MINFDVEEFKYLSAETRHSMVLNALEQLETKIFEAQLNAEMSDYEYEVPMPSGETAYNMIARLDRQRSRLVEKYLKPGE